MDTNFVEFYWADFLRNRITWDDTKVGSALGSGQSDANLIKAPLSFFVAVANGIALGKSELYRDRFGRSLADYDNAAYAGNTQAWANASIGNGLAKAGETYHMYLRDDSTIVGDITPSALSINKMHIDTTAGMTIAGSMKNMNSVTINGGGSILTSWRDAALNSFNSTLTLSAGTNKVTLTAPNSYTGTTDVMAGTLALVGAGSIGQSSAITIAAGALLDVQGTTLPFKLNATQTLTDNGSVNGGIDAFGIIGGSGILASDLTLESGAHLAPGTGPGTLSLMNGLVLDHGSTLELELGTASDLVRVLGGSFLGSDFHGTEVDFSFGSGFVPNATYTVIDWTGATPIGVDATDFLSANAPASFSIVGNNLMATVVPEPGTAALLLLAVPALLLRRRSSAVRG